MVQRGEIAGMASLSSMPSAAVRRSCPPSPPTNPTPAAHLHAARDALAPPGKVLCRVRLPLVQRAAPQLPRLTEGIRGHAAATEVGGGGRQRSAGQRRAQEGSEPVVDVGTGRVPAHLLPCKTHCCTPSGTPGCSSKQARHWLPTPTHPPTPICPHSTAMPTTPA